MVDVESIAIAASHYRQTAEPVEDIPFSVGRLGRCGQYNTIYQTSGVAGPCEYHWKTFLVVESVASWTNINSLRLHKDGK